MFGNYIWLYLTLRPPGPLVPALVCEIASNRNPKNVVGNGKPYHMCLIGIGLFEHEDVAIDRPTVLVARHNRVVVNQSETGLGRRSSDVFPRVEEAPTWSQNKFQMTKHRKHGVKGPRACPGVVYFFIPTASRL